MDGASTAPTAAQSCGPGAGLPWTAGSRMPFQGGRGINAMFSHVMVGTNDLDRAKVFYDAVLATLGVRPGQVDRHRVFWRTKTGAFGVTRPIDGEAATIANGGTI